MAATAAPTSAAPLPTPPPVPAIPPTSTSVGSTRSGLNVGSAVGIAFGVFVAGAVLVAVALFLFLRRRTARRDCDRDSQSWNLTKPQLESLAGVSSRPLSSTWSASWLGSLPVASEPDKEHKYQYPDGARTSWPNPLASSSPVHIEHQVPQHPKFALVRSSYPPSIPYLKPAGSRDVLGMNEPRATQDREGDGERNPFADPRARVSGPEMVIDTAKA